MKFRNILGVDFGGSGIKGTPVDAKNGKLLDNRYRIPTPVPATPEEVAATIKSISAHFKWEGPIGLAFPAVVRNGIVKTAANIDKKWIDVNASTLIKKKTGLPTYVLNDADAAGMAEMKFGAGKGRKGTVLLITVGTGIGTVLFSKGKLVPNTELGHITLKSGIEAEEFTSDAVRKREKLSWDDWANRFNIYLQEMEQLFWPELIIIGGGVSKKKELFFGHLQLNSEVVMAKTQNEAGIIGAALACRANRNLFN
jgi:polyphosphate glucokinase